MHYIRNSSVHD
jgi:hypothetical protein